MDSACEINASESVSRREITVRGLSNTAQGLLLGPKLLDCSRHPALRAELVGLSWYFEERVPCELHLADIAVHQAWSGAVLLWDLLGETNANDVRLVRRMRDRFPELPIIAVGPPLSGAKELAASVGAVFVEFGTSELSRALRGAALNASTVSVAQQIIRRAFRERLVQIGTPERFVALVAQAGRNVKSVAACADMLGVSMRTLQRRFRDASLGDPRSLFWEIQVCRAVFTYTILTLLSRRFAQSFRLATRTRQGKDFMLLRSDHR